MKVTYLVHQFYPEYYTGTEKFVFSVASMMQKAGHNVHVITYGFYHDSFFERQFAHILYKEFVFKGIRVTAIRHKKIPENIHITLGDTSMRDIARHLLATEKPDILHVGHPMRVSEFILASQELGIPYIITLTDFWLVCPKVNLINAGGDLCAGTEGLAACETFCPELPGDMLFSRSECARNILCSAKKVISPSDFLGGFFRNEFGDTFNISVISHGISYKRIKRSKRHYKRTDRLVFCYAGSLNDHKGVHILLQAFKMIKSTDVRLAIYGSGPNPFYVNSLFDMGKEDTRIEFRGVYSEENIGDIFSNVDVVIIPSIWYESYSLVLHEALACNTPVLVSDIGVMAEKVKDGLQGFSFQMGDAEALKSAMEKIIANPEILNTLKENIRHLSIPTVEQEAYLYYRVYRNSTQ